MTNNIMSASSFFKEIDPKNRGFIVIKNGKAVYSYSENLDYVYTEYDKENMDDFVYSFLDLEGEVGSYPLDDESVVIVIGEPHHNYETCELLKKMMMSIGTEVDNKIISSIVGIEYLEKTVSIKIPKDFYELINNRLAKTSHKINNIFSRAISDYKIRPLNPSEMVNVRFTEDNTGIIMNDPNLGDIIVRSKKRQPFCEYHQLENIQCIHVEKANLVKNFRKMLDLDKPELPQTNRIKIRESVLIQITSEMVYELEQIRNQKKFEDISETLCYVTVNSFNKEISCE